MDQLSHVMKMDSITKELGMELNGDSLLARAEQLTKVEEELLGKKSTQLLTLQKQLQNTKKQLETKELHLDVLRKKVASGEIESAHRVYGIHIALYCCTIITSDFLKAEKDWHEVMERNQKLNKQVEKLQKQLFETKRHVSGAKADSIAFETLRVTEVSFHCTLLHAQVLYYK